MSFDGSDDSLDATLGASLTGRTYCWMVARAAALPGATAYAGIAYAGAAGVLAPLRMTTTNFTAVVASGDGTDIIVGPTRDTSTHLFEASFETSGTGRFVVDGVSYNGSFTGGPFGGSIANVCLGAFKPPESNNGPFEVFEYGLTTSLPSAAQRSALRAYVHDRYGIM